MYSKKHIEGLKKQILSEGFATFSQIKRELPWREKRTFYRVWISEVMLQQTQVDTVIPFYKRFLKRFPSIEALASANLEDVLYYWQGLGYYSRARNLHRAAQKFSKMKSLPTVYEELIQFPGFGPYTSAAVLCFTFKKPYPVVDGNIKRIISRIFAIKEEISSPQAVKKIQSLMQSLLISEQPHIFNEAMMEFGALICTPKKPQCFACPFQKFCKAYQQKNVSLFPNKKRVKPLPTKEQATFIFHCKQHVFIQKRKEYGLLGGLWHFPTIPYLSNKKLITHIQGIKSLKNHRILQPVKHRYSHFKLILTPVYGIIETRKHFAKNGVWVSVNHLKNYAFDKATHLILKQLELD